MPLPPFVPNPQVLPFNIPRIQIELPSFPFPQIQIKSPCEYAEEYALDNLDTQREKAAWTRYINGTGDWNLSMEDSQSVLGSDPGFSGFISQLTSDCSCSANGWMSKADNYLLVAGDPWVKAIGQVNVMVITDCCSGQLKWMASFTDQYDFNPMWFDSTRSPEAEKATRQVWLASFFCGWEEYDIIGMASGQ